MTSTIEAMKLALRTLEAGDVACEVMAASMLREAIAREEAQSVEPFAWVTWPHEKQGDAEYLKDVTAMTRDPMLRQAWERKGYRVEPLYTHPSPDLEAAAKLALHAIERSAPHGSTASSDDHADAAWLRHSTAIAALKKAGVK